MAGALFCARSWPCDAETGQETGDETGSKHLTRMAVNDSNYNLEGRVSTSESRFQASDLLRRPASCSDASALRTARSPRIPLLRFKAVED